MKITTTLNNKHYESPLTREQLIALLDTDKTLDICFQEKQVYDRMQVLRGEYDPPLKSDYFNIIPNRSEIFKGHCYYRVTEDIPKGYRFFPTRELAEEFLFIEKGEWVPRAGDEFWTIHRDNLKPAAGECGATWGLSHCHNPRTVKFPSSKQRDAYIDKNKKPALPTVEELLQDWGLIIPSCSFETTVPYWWGKSVFKADWLLAVFKSRFIAERIRKAEREMGYDIIGNNYLVAREHYKDSALMTFPLSKEQVYGTEYFATKAGAELYRDAMSTDLQHLLTK